MPAPAKPEHCPFCGSRDARLLGSPLLRNYWVVQCGECYASTRHVETKAAAVAAWNRRAERAAS